MTVKNAKVERCRFCERAVMGLPSEMALTCGACTEAHEEGADRERRRVCEWLRSPDQVGVAHTATIAKEIERGDHAETKGGGT